MSSTPAVEVERLTHAYGVRTALDGVSFAVGTGQLFGLLGPNGGGKSTLFRILSTLLTPTSGQARVFGEDVVRDPQAVRRQIGVVFQSPSLDSRLSVEENLRHQGRLYGMRNGSLAGNAAVWRLPRGFSINRACCCSMSLPPASTPGRVAICASTCSNCATQAVLPSS
jgi:ABC-type multidrug transport system ATPase subunit